MEANEKKSMCFFLIETPHTPAECAEAVKHIGARGWLTHFHWGCKSGDHTGYAMMECQDSEEAKNMLPPFLRERARIQKLDNYSKEEVDTWH